MKVLRYAAMILAISLAGCLANQVGRDLSERIDVFGIELYSDVDYREIGGVRGTEEPCLKGYERTFDPLDIIIGYGFNRKIRKISTQNPKTSMFGIAVGMSAERAGKLARQAGMAEVSPVRYRGNKSTLFILVDGKGKVFGMTVETVD
jgi:hypothetical protein